MVLRRTLTFACLSLAVVACTTTDDPSNDDEVGDTGETGSEAGAPCDPAADAVDESSCVPLASDYTPATPDDDPYGACVSDAGVYELIADPPGSIGRIEAYDEIAEILWRRADAPSADDFTTARTIYEADQGLGSRVDRREDLHYPPIPEAEWDPGLDPDKQCANETNATNHPDRCVGPAKLRPLINGAFIDGMSGTGDPNTAAATIEAGFVWFAALSVYKEASTCLAKAKDCDSAWAYYTGGAQVDGALLGFAALVEAYSPGTHQRIFDGILAVRCFRDLYPIETYATYDDLPEDGKQTFDDAWAQVDTALQRGLAVALRQHLLAQDDDQCSEASAANWAFVQILGGVIDREAQLRDPANADALSAILELDAPTSEDIEAAAVLLDGLIPCS